MQKKENAKLKEEVEEFTKIIKEKQQDEEQIDIQTFVQEADPGEANKQSKLQFAK